jgi:hypothetical protein
VKYVSNNAEYCKICEQLDFLSCPHCQAIGNLNRHGQSKRFNELTGQDTIFGGRVFCNDRGNMTGCGRTFSIVLIEHMHHYVVSCVSLWNFLLHLLEDNVTIKACWETVTSAFCLDTGYKLRKSFIRNLSHIRIHLSKLGPPEKLEHTKDPVLQTIHHLRTAFGSFSCPVSAFQLRFQKPFLT